MPAAAPSSPGISAGLRLDGAMLSDVGRVRKSNEDMVVFSLASGGVLDDSTLSFAVVADGMGGHNAGEVASALAAEVVRQVLQSAAADPLAGMEKAIRAANRAVFTFAGTNPDCAGMGTTCTALAFAPRGLVLGHVGDSRAYRLRAGRLEQLSDDQTVTAQMMRNGEMTAQEALTSKYANYLLQSIGTKAEVEPEIWQERAPVRHGDVYLLCSDGLTGGVSDVQIADILRACAPRLACERLVRAACDAGGSDNISVGVFHAVDISMAPRDESGEGVDADPDRRADG